MKDIFSSLVRSQSGQSVLAIVLILVILGALILGPLLAFMSTGLKVGQMHETRAQEFYAADSGVEDAISWLMCGKPTDGDWDWNWDGSRGGRVSYELNDRTVDVTVEALPEANLYKVTSSATGPDGSTTVLSTVWTIAWLVGDQVFDNQNPPPSGDVHVDGDATLAGNIDFTGDLTVTGSVTAMNNVRVTGNISAAGDVIFENSAELTGTLCCGGNITVGNGCAIYGLIRLQADNATITLAEAGAYVEANIWADGNLTIDIATNAPIIGDIYAPVGNIDIYLGKPNAEIVGDIYAGGSIQILDDTGKPIDPANIHEDYTDPPHPPPFPEPQCPVPPEKKADMLSYEVT